MPRSLNPTLFGPIETPVVKVDGGALQTKKIRDIEMQIEATNQKLDRYVQILEQKIQHTSNHQKALVDQLKLMADGFSKQIALLHSRMNERRVADVKSQELVDRHNQLVQNFDQRMAQVQKLTSEQEMKIMTYQATYDEILREIRNLKPGKN